jgi:C4-dicarboxylate transporter, DctM subunit
MDPFVTVFALLAVVLLALGTGLWVFAGLFLSAFFCFFVLLDFPPVRVGSIVYPIILRNSFSFELAAVPLFIWMGEIISRTDISARLFRGLSPWVGSLPGGLLHANIGGAVLFSALSGSSVATTATIGRVTTRELIGRGYDPRLVLGSITVAGTIGIMIPPSITLIVYGLIAEVSVAKLFAAGVLPGIMLGALYSGYIAVRVLITPTYGVDVAAYPWRARLLGLADLLPVTVLIVFILGSIYGGYATPSESAAVGVFGAAVIARLTSGLTLRALYDAAMSAVLTTSMIGSAVAAAALLATAVGFLHMPQLVAGAIADLALSPLQLILLLTLIYIVMGCVLDGISMILMTVPIVLPPLLANGFDPVWVGVYLVLMVEIGLVTPPVGFNLFVLRSITGTPIGQIAYAATPFFLMMLFGGALLIAFPQIALWLPNQLR